MRTWDANERARTEAALRESEGRYRLIVESARDYAILTTDRDGRIESWSPGAEAVYGWPADEAVGQPIAMTFVPEDRAAGIPEMELGVAAADGVAPDVRWHLRRDGARVFIDGTTRALRGDAGELRGFLKVGQDVTLRRELDEALRASEARYRALVDNLRDHAIFLLDAHGVVTEWTLGAERVTGYGADESVGRHFSFIFPPEDVAAGSPARELAEARAHGRAEREGWRVRRDGTRFWASEVATAVHDGDGRLIGFAKITRDLSERRLAQEAAARARAEADRSRLRRELLAAEEAERRRLARELHDQLGQQLTAFTLGLDDASRLVASTEVAATPAAGQLLARLAQLQGLAQAMTSDARYLALELRPPELDDVGFESALATYVAEWASRYDIAAEVAVTGSAVQHPLPPEVGSALYRIVQEALTNVAKHARASHVVVQLEKPGREVRLLVEDDGRGFEPDATAERVRRERRLGVASMRERAAMIGGELEVESSPERGATVYVRVPLERS